MDISRSLSVIRSDTVFVVTGQVCLQSGLHPQEKPIGFGAFSCPQRADCEILE